MRVQRFLIGAVLGAVLIVTVVSAKGEWAPVEGKIMTPWAEKVRPGKVLPEYPRPMMVRKKWENLNGLWDYAIVSKEAEKPATFQGKILVPFAIESALSGVGKSVGSEKALWYRRSFKVPSSWKGRHVLLHFGAVDYKCTVWVNGQEVGSHTGGYDPFTFEITDALKQRGEQAVVLRVWDPTNENNSPQPRGKQVVRPGGIFYTAVTGIWQTVWLEPLADVHVQSLKITPHFDDSAVIVDIVARVAGSTTVKVEVLDGRRVIQTGSITAKDAGSARPVETVRPRIELGVPDAKPWSPESPFLYGLRVTLSADGKKVDRVESYFGMRKISVGKDDKGVLRLFLNNRPLFQLGPLDQGWWPDGLYTAPTDEALRYDLEVLKELGFNMLRKHVKAEPARLYYWCDKLGLLVWQDMPSSLYDRRRIEPAQLKEIDRQWELELKRMIDALYNHPSIIMWVPFNEGWGQYDTERITEWIKGYDPTRLVNNASGWSDRGVGDVLDIHSYPGPAMPELEEHRAAVLGEFGGLGLPVEGHLWQASGNWGYRSHEQLEQYEDDYIGLIQKLYEFVDKGLAAAVYTQTTDCEVETNGLITYDRKVVKLDPKRFAGLNRGDLPPQFGRDEELFIDTATIQLEAPDKPAKIRYTLDGSVPTKRSAFYVTPISVKEDTTIKACCFWPDGRQSVVVSKRYRPTTAMPAVWTKVENAGLRFEYYEGRWERLPDFAALKPTKTGVAEQMDLTCVDDDSDYGLRFTGFFKAPATGVYSFYVNSDDGTKLTVAGKEIVANDGVHGMREVGGGIGLEKGRHKIELVYFQGRGGQGLEVAYRGPGVAKTRIPAEALGH